MMNYKFKLIIVVLMIISIKIRMILRNTEIIKHIRYKLILKLLNLLIRKANSN